MKNMDAPEFMPPGFYAIGDPCYVIQNGTSQDQWMEYLHAFGLEEQQPRVFLFNNLWHFVSPTTHGDGIFLSSFGKEYPVDAGLIGATPITHGTTKEEIAKWSNLVDLVEFESPFQVFAKDGKIHIEREVIDTAPDIDYEW